MNPEELIVTLQFSVSGMYKKEACLISDKAFGPKDIEFKCFTKNRATCREAGIDMHIGSAFKTDTALQTDAYYFMNISAEVIPADEQIAPEQLVEAVETANEAEETKKIESAISTDIAAMKVSGKWIERIICGDNLKIIKDLKYKLSKESVDLVYADPPFFTNEYYEKIWNDDAEILQFEDRWATTESETGKTSSKDINKFLIWIEARIRAVYDLMKPTATFYLHCDWHADGYLRVLCDKIFGMKNFITQISWRRCSRAKPSRLFGNNVDHILVYSKSNNYTAQQIIIDLKENVREQAMIEKETHRPFFVQSMLNKLKVGHEPTLVQFHDRKDFQIPIGYTSIISQSKYDAMYKENNLCIYWTKGCFPKVKVYCDDKLGGVKHNGIAIDNLWTDIHPIGAIDHERLGYPTQKPIELLKRVILASSNEGGLVLDPFCGGGTTLAAARELNRQFIGIDVSPVACHVVAKRLGIEYKQIQGLPMTPEEFQVLSGIEFQNWCTREIGAIDGKLGADGGIDGMLYNVPIQVKKFQTGRPQLDAFVAALYRQSKKDGIFIALSFAMNFVKEVARLLREQGIAIHAYTAQDIIDKKHIEYVKGLREKDAA